MEDIKSSLEYTRAKFKKDIEMLIESELEAIEDYELVLDNIESTEYEESLKPILDEILADEKDHLKKLNEYKSKYLVKDSDFAKNDTQEESTTEASSVENKTETNTEQETASNVQEVKDDNSLLTEEEWDKLEESLYTNDVPMHSEVLPEYNRLVGYDNMSDAYIVKSFIEQSTDYKADVKHLLNRGWVVDITK